MPGYSPGCVLVCGSSQMCTGFQAAIEGAIHGINDLFSTHQSQAQIEVCYVVVDAGKVFNSLNWTARLLHACVFWPHYVCFPFITYRG